AGTTSIGGNFTLSGSTATTAVIGLTIGGNITLGSGTSFTAGDFIHNIAGNWTNNGGTFTTSTSTINFTGNSSSINGTAATQTFNNFTLNKTSQTLSVGGSTTAIVVNGTTLLTAGNFAAPVTLTANGNFTNNSGGFQSGTNTVIFAGNTSTINGSATTTFYNLTINKTVVNRQNLGANIFVDRLLTLSSGIVALSNFNFTFGANALTVQGSPSASNMIVATGTGRARKTFSSAGSFLLPIGEETGTAEYSPFSVTISSASFALDALVEVHVT
ncbi:hypothetical protein JZU68_00885, partial [bacterium]|nr:hypothetical protein [bacterium]